ncbi:protein Shroom3 [Tachyglossus aculeatus]|uniref:protein Shroom3 n=1 Tax=Tachyglossus aculeatus TaxID=9261 RepID=UPI0018F5DB09|nr:protein Shroom3 [Tachyglossus aculeatus]
MQIQRKYEGKPAFDFSSLDPFSSINSYEKDQAATILGSSLLCLFWGTKCNKSDRDGLASLPFRRVERAGDKVQGNFELQPLEAEGLFGGGAEGGRKSACVHRGREPGIDFSSQPGCALEYPDTRLEEEPAETAVPQALGPGLLGHDPQQKRAAWSGAVKLRQKNRRGEPGSRPHSWHSTKCGENPSDASMMQVSQGMVGPPWHQPYHSSSSASDLSSLDHGYPRTSPDQYSSRGSMESLDPGGYPPRHLLSPAKSTSSIDQMAHLHSKRDSAYSSFSTSSSVLEYPPPPGLPSWEGADPGIPASPRPSGLAGMRQADIRYIKTVYDSRHGVSAEYEVDSSAVLLPGGESRELGERGPRGGGPPAQIQRCLGPPEAFPDQPCPKMGAPQPPARRDSYAATRHHERAGSRAGVDQIRPRRSPGPSEQQVPLEQQPDPVPQKGLESGPPARAAPVYARTTRPGQPLLPTGVYPVPAPEPHFAQVPQPPASGTGTLYPALAKESGRVPAPHANHRMATSGQDGASRQSALFPRGPDQQPAPVAQRKPEAASRFVSYQPHFLVGPEATSVRRGESDAIAEEVGGTFAQGNGSPPSVWLGSRRSAPEPPLAPAWEGREDHQGPGPSGVEFPEGQEVTLRWRPERDGPVQTPRAGCLRTRSAFRSLQDIPEGTRGDGSPEPREGQPVNYLSGRLVTMVGDQREAEEEGHRPDPTDPQPRSDRSGFGLGTEAKPIIPALTFLRSERRPQEPTSPPLPKTASPGQSPLILGGPLSPQPCRSVLEKVSLIEQRESGSQRSPNVGILLGHTYRPSGPETGGPDLAALNSPENSVGEAGVPGPKEPSVQAGEVRANRALWAPPESTRQTPPLSRSQSTVQLSRTSEREAQWRDDGPDSPQLDGTFNRAYRNSIKSAQSRVLGATSFRRRDLDLGLNGSVPARSGPRQRPTSAHVGPSCPGAHMAAATVAAASPHRPRERHSVTPGDGSSPREGPGPPATRIGARRRLTAEQKKRSYSEPEKMNEVGVAEEGELSPRKGPALSFLENTVADRRRIFEREGKACSTLSLSRPQLKQFQQSVLADYVQRKTASRLSSGSSASSSCCFYRETGAGGLLREHSQSLAPQPCLGAACSGGLSSASSMNSLQEQSPGPRWASEAGRVSSTLPPGLSGALALGGSHPKGALRDRSSSLASIQLPGDQRLGSRPRGEQGWWTGGGSRGSQWREWAWERVPPPPPSRNSGKSMSAEDLLERPDGYATPVHVRSKSSPVTAKKGPDLLLEESSDCGLLGQDPPGLAEPGAKALRSPRETPSQVHYSGPHRASFGLQGAGNLIRRPATFKPAGTEAQPRDPRPPLPPPASELRAGWAESACWAELVGRQPPSPEGLPVPTRGSPRSPEAAAEERRQSSKVLPPERPPPPRVRWASLLGPGSTAETPKAPVPSWVGQAQASSPDSDPSHHPFERVSLRISESALRSSPPPPEEAATTEDNDDDVFVRDMGSTPAPGLSWDAPPPPPPPPPPGGLWGEGLDELPLPPPPVQLLEALDSWAQGPSVGAPVSSNGSSRAMAEGDRQTQTPVSCRGSQTPAPTSGPETFLRPSGAQRVSSTPVLGSRSTQPCPEQLLPAPAKEPTDLTPESDRGHLDSRKTQEDVRSEALAKEIICRDKSLANILDPDSRRKTTMDLMEGIFPKSPSALRGSNPNTKCKEVQHGTNLPGPERLRSEEKEAVGASTSRLTYSGVSAPKDRSTEAGPGEDQEQLDINEKKVELIRSLTLKLERLKEEKESLLADLRLNGALGEEVEAWVDGLCKPNEMDKYRMFVGDLDKVVSLLLSLSGRLARVENALSGLGPDASNEERSALKEKRRLLAGQHQDACELKENLDRRAGIVLDIVAHHLTDEQLGDYRHFVRMKSALLIEQRALDDRIQLGQEQLKCLLDSLPPAVRATLSDTGLPAVRGSPPQ